MSIRHRLAAEYDRLPTITCKGLCQQACGPIACSQEEARLMHRRAGRPLTCGEDLRCGYLNDDGKCDVYRERPLVCRVFGVVSRMPCPHGCEPSHQISREQERAIFLKVMEIGGEPIVFARGYRP